jgi:hypothetical protein
VSGAGAPALGEREDPPPPGRPRERAEAGLGEGGRARGPPRPSPPAAHLPQQWCPRGSRQARPGPAASPGYCPELVPRPAVLGGGGEEGKEEGRRERRKGRREGRGGVAAEKADAAGPGGRSKEGVAERDSAVTGVNAEEPLRRPQPSRK